MRHILGVYGKKSYNVDKKDYDYDTKIVVSQDVIDWLNNHDVEISESGDRIYVMNRIKYIYLGIELDLSLTDLNRRKMETYQYMYDIIMSRIEILLAEEREKFYSK